MCHHFRRLCFWDSWAVTSWTVLFSYRGREAARNGITNSSVLTSASCVCLYACACDGCRGFCQPSGYFFDFQETMIMFILDTWSLSMLKNQVATWQLVIFFLLLLLPRLLPLQPPTSSPFPPAMGTWRQFNLNHSAFLLAQSISLSAWFLARTYCQHCWLCPGARWTSCDQSVSFLWQICTGSQLPFNNLRLHPQACDVAVCSIRIPVYRYPDLTDSNCVQL